MKPVARLLHLFTRLAAGWWLCVALLLALTSVHSRAAAASLVLDKAATYAGIGPRFSVLQDPSARWTLDDVRQPRLDAQWLPETRDNPNYGYSRSAFWLRAEVRNDSPLQHDWLLGLRYPLTDYVDIYLVHADGRVEQHHTGDRRPFAQRPIKDRHFYAATHLPTGSHMTVYVRVQGQGSLQVPIEVTTPALLQQTQHREQVLMALYGGAVLTMLIYNALLWLSLRDRSHLYYVGYVGAFALAQLALNGMAYEWLWPESPNWGNEAVPLTMALTGWLLTLFSREFLGLRQHWPAADRILQIQQWVFGAVVPAALWMDYGLPIRVATAGSLSAPLLLLGISAVMLQRGRRQARYFLAAFGGLLVGVVLSALQMFGLVQASFLTEHGLQIGSALELTLLSFALAHRVKLAQDDNESMQRAHAAELEARVQARTLDLDRAMDELTQANIRLQDMSMRDALTGMKNRLFLAEHLPVLWRQAVRWKEPLSLLMIDIDHFKQINDRLGHAAGDDALRWIAELITRHLRRPGDEGVRFGGEEFLVMLPRTDRAGALVMAERIRECVVACPWTWAGQSTPLTISIGGAGLSPTASDSVDTLMKQADDCLYAAKHQGRNRSIMSSVSPTPVSSVQS